MSNTQTEIKSNIPLEIAGRGWCVSTPGNAYLPENLRYSVPLTAYELRVYDCSRQHRLCFKCYSKIFNRARFGLCRNCFSDDEMKTVLVSDADQHTVYLSRRGGKVRIVGGMVRIPICDNAGKISTYDSKMERPYVVADDLLRRPDYEIVLASERTMRFKAHGLIPMNYLLAELD